MIERRYSLLFRLTVHLLKYFLLAVCGFTITCLLSETMGAIHAVQMIVQMMGPWLLRSAVVIICFMGMAIILESIRQ
ncbi:hypothetical protein BST81_02190 [Leptolyngbya sp. 'hensonii']|nr:hypothetical protein BST81_02190 [Leptolyngbya sp. 'hensonii']